MKRFAAIFLALASCAPFETENETARNLYLEARERLGSGEAPETVRPVLDDAIELDRSNPSLFLLRAEVDRRLHQADDAEEDYTRAIVLLRDLPEEKADLAAAYLGRAILRASGSRPDSAEEDFTAVLSIEPGNAEALLLRSRLRRRIGRTTEADADLDQVRREGGPGLIDRTYNGGVRELQNRRAVEAERLFQMAVELDPKCVRAWLGIARCTMEEGRYSEASGALTHAIDCEPQAAELYYHRANAFRVQERWEEAFADALRALDRDPRNPAYFVLRGIIYREYQKDHEKADRDFSQALEIDPTLASAYFERGILYHDMRLLNDAERDLRQALGRHGTADGVIALASVLRDKGEFDKASEALRGALEVYPAPGVRKRLQAEIERTAQAKEADH